MARVRMVEVDRDVVDAMAERWRDTCLLEDGSLLFDDRSLWRREALAEFLRRFKLPAAPGGPNDFFGRLAHQLDGASESLRWLVAEVFAVYALPAYKALGARGKLNLVRAPLGELDPAVAPHWPQLEAAFAQGIGNPGQRFNARRDIQLEFLLDFAIRLKAHSPAERAAIVADPWRLRTFADDVEPRLRGEMRHALLHLLHPDSFERIFSAGHKQRVIAAFSPELEQAGRSLPDDTDERLLAIRSHLEQQAPGGPPVDFYRPPYEAQWRPPEGLDLDDAEEDPPDPVEPRWYWVNQGQNQSYKAAAREGVLWAPLVDKSGQPWDHYDRLSELRPGDWIVHYSGAIQALSRVVVASVQQPEPEALAGGSPQREGRLVRSDYHELTQPIPLTDLPDQWRLDERNGPFNSSGGVAHGYLRPLSQRFVQLLLGRFEELREIVGLPLPPVRERTLADVHREFATAVASSGLLVPEDRVRALLAALATKPFAILSGLSGSGKTQLALRLGEWFGAPDAARSLVVPVRPDWTGPESLFGFEDALRPSADDGRRAWHVPAALAFMLDAAHDPEYPYLLLLDEMNLAHVERYFSDFLSGVESGKEVLPNLHDEGGLWRRVPDGPDEIGIPANLFVVGTVNVDETTYLFSPKVLDRAFTFEIRTGADELVADLTKPTPVVPGPPDLLTSFARIAQDTGWHLEHPHPQRETISEALRELHRALALTGDEFGHRVFYESMRFAAALAAVADADADAVLDHLVLLKILPRIHGSRRRVEPVLQRLQRFTEAPDATPAGSEPVVRLPLTRTKLDRMLQVLLANQFVSFSE